MEILAAVAIVSVLVAITLKIGNAAKLSSASVKCMSNMRQIGMAINSYAADNDNSYPPIVVSTQGWKYWDMELIWPYATGLSSSSSVNYFTTYKGSIFQCPASDPKKTCSYGMNAMFPDGIKKYDQPRKRNSITKPSSCLLLGEGTNHLLDSWWYSSAGQPMTFPHNGRQNLLFADLHTESRKKEDIPMGGWSQPETTDPFWTGN